MEFQLPIQLSPIPQPIRYQDKILLTGSCFTEHIGGALRDWKFEILQNPNGILFDPASVASSLISYINTRPCKEEDLVFFNELWQSWQHHSLFSHTDKTACLRLINESRAKAHAFLKEANWLIITLGSSFSYRLVPEVPDFLQNAPARTAATAGIPYPVANCHRAPAPSFQKHLMTIEEINTALDNCLYQLFLFNPKIRVIFTVSPVRHVRDGVIENNRSKARLLESVHHLVNKFDRISYFPAYELVIDVLRDYRFYDIDMVHPNYQATSFVLEKFTRFFIDEPSQQLMEELKKIVIARKHRPFQPTTRAHKKFLLDHWEKTVALKARYPFLDLEDEIAYFSSATDDRAAAP
ncbi:MAG TPA: GSCFA domain-containing protein [Puia sp.]|nr:GSCFA domain-containing protein [Puia sp.]